MSQQGTRERFSRSTTREKGWKGKQATESTGKTSANVARVGQTALLRQLLSHHTVRTSCAMTSSPTGKCTVY